MRWEPAATLTTPLAGCLLQAVRNAAELSPHGEGTQEFALRLQDV
jgi:hypothetical protein